jgi:hypothetical protein
MELVITKDGPDAQRCRKTAQNRNLVLPGLAVPFENIPEQDHEVGLLSLYLSDTCLQPLCVKQRSHVQVGHGNKYCAIHLTGKAGEVYVIVLNHWRPQALYECDQGKRSTGNEGKASN